MATATAEKNLEKTSKSPSDSEVDALEASTGINEKKLLRKLDRRLLPPVTLLYLLSFLDRSNGKVRELALIHLITDQTRRQWAMHAWKAWWMICT